MFSQTPIMLTLFIPFWGTVVSDVSHVSVEGAKKGAKSKEI